MELNRKTWSSRAESDIPRRARGQGEGSHWGSEGRQICRWAWIKIEMLFLSDCGMRLTSPSPSVSL